MNSRPHLPKPSGQHSPGEGTTTRLLEDAVATFSANRGSAIGKLQKLQAHFPSGITHAAIHLLESAEKTSGAFEHTVGLLAAGNFLVELLMDTTVWSLKDAVELAHKLPTMKPRLEVRIVRHVLGKTADGVGSMDGERAMRLLGLIDATSDCSILGSHLIQFQRHSSDKVRSKAALMLGRCNHNPIRAERLMASDDGRLRANVVESLWGHGSRAAGEILWKATQDPTARVAVNALLGLCRIGDREACSRLGELADAPDPRFRLSAAWAMGEIGDQRFAEALEKLARDEDAKVRERADNSRKKLAAPPEVKPTLTVQPHQIQPDQVQPDPSASDPEESTVTVRPTNGWMTGSGGTG
jgi:HEAT repeats